MGGSVRNISKLFIFIFMFMFTSSVFTTSVMFPVFMRSMFIIFCHIYNLDIIITIMMVIFRVKIKYIIMLYGWKHFTSNNTL